MHFDGTKAPARQRCTNCVFNISYNLPAPATGTDAIATFVSAVVPFCIRAYQMSHGSIRRIPSRPERPVGAFLYLASVAMGGGPHRGGMWGGGAAEWKGAIRTDIIIRCKMCKIGRRNAVS